MTPSQKIIKYGALSLALFLIIIIASAILNSFLMVTNFLGLAKENKYIQENLEVISDHVEELETLKLDLDFTNLQIKTGQSFQAETNNSKISFTNKNGNVMIKEKQHRFFWNKSNKGDLIITLPKNQNTLKEVTIETQAGQIKIDTLQAQKLSLDLGAGDLWTQNLTITKECKISGGAGKTEIVNSELNDLNADLGVGEFILSGKLTGTNKIDSGIGSIHINLMDNKSNYNITLSKGLGTVTLDGEKIKEDQSYGTGNTHLAIDGGIGEIKVDFKK